LHEAAMHHSIEVVRYLVEEGGANVDEQNNEGLTALHMAVKESDLKLVQCLINEGGADLDVKDNNGDTVLHMAILKYLQYSRCLENEKQKASPDSLLKFYENWLQISLQIFQWLVKEGCANVDIKDAEGNTVLLLAAKAYNLFIIQWLLEECGSKVTDKNNQGHTLFSYASPNIVQMLLKNGAGIKFPFHNNYLAILNKCDLKNSLLIGTSVGNTVITRAANFPASCNINSAITNINELRVALGVNPQDESAINFVAVRNTIKQRLDILDRQRQALDRNFLTQIMHALTCLHSLKYRCLVFIVDNRHKSIIKVNIPKLPPELQTIINKLTEQALGHVSKTVQCTKRKCWIKKAT
jgi:ankyrin repeat protein